MLSGTIRCPLLFGITTKTRRACRWFKGQVFNGWLSIRPLRPDLGQEFEQKHQIKHVLLDADGKLGISMVQLLHLICTSDPPDSALRRRD